ncbi:metalloregulator ArsR/SmtB family transcription factor [Bradyrhizobium sp. ARR65]|uniref:ArsR/SmtB family transcription factor n=1 Tax=Bradyrhizobium sp. ARR65 TaxID=1040989 RepID=UPI000465DAD6|nr:metalloregulator ArsR/SmtB family transcription factor [Bradyrhizobium sp. ARR65]
MLDQPVQSGFSKITQALSDPAREAMVSALADGRALPAGELAAIAGISPQSASAHLQKLVDARVLAVWAQGRFRYYRIADDEVALLVESLVNLATKAEGAARRRASVPEALRQSRSCYHHLAGELGVLLSDAMIRRKLVALEGRTGHVTAAGLAWCDAEDIDFTPAHAPHVRLCNDWTQRVPHLSGPLPNAVLRHLLESRCLVRRRLPRALQLTRTGRAFFNRLGVDIPF